MAIITKSCSLSFISLENNISSSFEYFSYKDYVQPPSINMLEYLFSTIFALKFFLKLRKKGIVWKLVLKRYSLLLLVFVVIISRYVMREQKILIVANSSPWTTSYVLELEWDEEIGTV